MEHLLVFGLLDGFTCHFLNGLGIHPVRIEVLLELFYFRSKGRIKGAACSFTAASYSSGVKL